MRPASRQLPIPSIRRTPRFHSRRCINTRRVTAVLMTCQLTNTHVPFESKTFTLPVAPKFILFLLIIVSLAGNFKESNTRHHMKCLDKPKDRFAKGTEDQYVNSLNVYTTLMYTIFCVSLPFYVVYLKHNRWQRRTTHAHCLFQPT